MSKYNIITLNPYLPYTIQRSIFLVSNSKPFLPNILNKYL